MSRIKYFLVASIIVIGWVGKSYAQSSKQDILQKLSQIRQHQSTFNIKLWVNQKAYLPGDPIEFSFRTDRDCYLTLIDVATEGVIRVIFPNKHSPDNFVQAGRTYNIPRDYNFNMRITGPSGIEQVKAIATTRKMDVFDMNLRGGDYFFFEGKPENEVITRGLGGLASKLKKQDAWTETSLEFEIIGAGSPGKKSRALDGKEDLPSPKPTPSTGTQEHKKTRGLDGTEDWPAPKPVPGTGTQEHKKTRGLDGTEDWPAPKPVPGTGTQEFK